MDFFGADVDELFSAFGGNDENQNNNQNVEDVTSNEDVPYENNFEEFISQRKRKRESAPMDIDAEPEVVPMRKKIKVIAADTADELSEARKACQHEVCIPEGWVEPEEPEDVSNRGPAKQYPFTLDPFQKVAVSCLEKQQSVLVAAHTSAGKTVVAEYAIAMSLRDNQRVIYTSPIKALSNQKYRELNEEFGDVGLMTGDITINPNASCLVMTTEILRSMLYRGSEILREVGCVIYDEIHYMRDLERGVVWEETIILLPDTVKFVFLSATIPNATQFASWIATIHSQPCHVVYTDYRPTPLQHFLFTSGGNGLHMVVDDKSNFLEENFHAALSTIGSSERTSFKKKEQQSKNDLKTLVKMIISRNYHPVIVFSFSKKLCEALALTMKDLTFNTEEESELVDKIFNNAIDSLSEDEKSLPSVVHILPLLRSGVGIHHSGLLPILKEVIEILFQEGLIKCLFATETFSIGLNMPAKTVVFSNARKFDGTDFRWVQSGEYIQMSGRAGRRGLDKRGIVILMIDEKMDPSVAKNMLQGESDKLNSSFHIGYNMLLNLLRVDGIEPEYMLRQSFHQFQNDQSIPEYQDRINHLNNELKGLEISNESLLGQYYSIRKELDKRKEQIRTIVNQPLHALPFLQTGRFVRVRDNVNDWGWGVIVNFQKRVSKKQSVNLGSPDQYIVDVLLQCDPNTQSHEPPRPCPKGEKAAIHVIPVLLHLLDGISSVRIHIPKDLTNTEQRQSVGNTIKEVISRFPDGIPMIDPIEDMKIEGDTFAKAVRKVESYEEKLADPKFENIDVETDFEKYLKKVEIEAEIEKLTATMRKTDNIILKDELKSMKRVLRRLGYTDKDNIVDLKGRVACEINCSDVLVLVELIFTGFFNSLTVEQLVALLSTFVFQGSSSDSNVQLSEDLSGPYRQLQDVARRVAKVSKDCKMEIDPDDYVAKFKPDLMEMSRAWCQGATFPEVIEITPIYEGSIIRSMRRLEELIRQLMEAAKGIGNTDLESKAAEAIAKIKRDIIFAASLYL
eukprot:TRINITY_DN2487_c0_g3_i1.p1 TRINITY_DN2487_c0_g3~~TRINITY_DN2487_c0_g3_i1.p1  ORF type:complete len:1028 (-),score=306.38 TRINITY_DN2487_c0_g3_i1:34-3093(-)